MDLPQAELLQSLPSPGLSSEVTRRTGFLDDHLPLPAHRAHSSVETPYLCAGKQYDNGSILTYHYRRGWTDADVHDVGQTGRSNNDVGEFFQSSFFFGLLRDVFGLRIDPNGLPDYVKRWYSQEQRVSLDEQERHAQRAANALFLVCNAMHDWEVHETSPFHDWTALYLIMLGQYLEYMLKRVFLMIANVEIERSSKSSGISRFCTGAEMNFRREVSDLLQMKYHFAWSGHDRVWPTLGYKSLEARMVVDGWCPSDVQRLRSTLMAYGLHAASMLKPPGRTKLLENSMNEKSTLGETPNSMPTSRQTDSCRQHQQCSEFKCEAYQIDERSYEIKHVSIGCLCNHIGADTSSLAEILTSGQVPLVQIGDGVLIVPAKPDSQYVAISHVWSDGLGNPKAISLPACQLICLAVRCKALCFSSGNSGRWWNDSALFWIDTICCPVEDKEARAQAISLMPKTYKEAYRVLVVESSLTSRSIVSTGPMELVLAIFCSKWQCRLWCLQERLLAKGRILFQFKDGAISTETAVKRALPQIEYGPLRGLPDVDLNPIDLTNPGCLQLVTMIQSQIVNATLGIEHRFANLNMPSATTMTTLQTLLPFRSTSRAADEALCLSTLIGVDPRRILSSTSDRDDSRMETLWKLMGEIPPEVIFWIGPKLQTKGFRWAPKTFMNAGEWPNPNGSYNEFGAVLTKDGLKVHFPGWILGCKPGLPIKAQFVTVDPHQRVYTVACLNCNTKKYYDQSESLNPWLQVGWTGGKTSVGTLYVLSRFDLDASVRLGPRVSYDAILVLAYQKGCASNEELLYARYICPVTVKKHEPEVGWTAEPARIVQRRSDISPEQRALGLWYSVKSSEPGVLDLIGCSAMYENHPWIID